MENVTTIQVSTATRRKLANFREYARETYDEIINKLMGVVEMVKSEGELSLEARKDVEISRREFREGKSYSTREVLEKLGVTK